MSARAGGPRRDDAGGLGSISQEIAGKPRAPHRIARRRAGAIRRLAGAALLVVLLSACGATPAATSAPAATTVASRGAALPVGTATPTAATVPGTLPAAAAPGTPVTGGGPRATPAGSSPAAAATPAAGSCAPGVDLLGWSDALDKATFAGTDVGGLSGLAYDAASDRYVAIVDNEGTTPARFYTLRIPLADGRLGAPQIVAGGLLRDGAGQGYTGRTFDGEGIALLPGGDLLIASETEPSIRRFAPDGRQLGALPVPQRFLVQPQGGGSTNLTFESLALAPGGQTLYTANEGPLAPDGLAPDGRGRIRLLRYDSRQPGDFAPAAQYSYLAEPAQGVSDLVALSDTDLIVLERGFIPGAGNTIRLFRVAVAGAADVSDQASLTAPNLAPLRKDLLLDLRDCPASGAKNPARQPNPLLDNIEGLALGPALPDGRRSLLLISDDNFAAEQVTRIIALAFRP